MAVDIQALNNRFMKAKARRGAWDAIYKEVIEYIIPEKDLTRGGSGADSGVSTPAQTPIQVLDSTASYALDGFTANMMSSLFPTGKKWIRLMAGNAIAPENREKAQGMLDEITNTVFSALALSNFHVEMATSFTDLAIGMASLKIDKWTKENPLRFEAVPIQETYPEEGPMRRVETVFREFKVSARNIERTWPDADIPEPLKEASKNNPDQDFTFVEATYPIKLKPLPGQKSEKPLEGYAYVVYETGCMEVLVYREQQSTPWIVYRWVQHGRELHGRGPALKALPDIQSVNKAQQYKMRFNALNSMGLWMGKNDGVVSTTNLVLSPGTLLPVESTGGVNGPDIAPLPLPGQIQSTEREITERQNAIYKAFFAEPLGRVDAPVKTATEVAYRQQEMSRRASAAFSKLMFELIQPLVNRVLVVLQEMGWIKLGEFFVDGQVININYLNPLAAAGDQDDVMNVTNWVSTVMGLYGPQVGMTLCNPAKITNYLADKLHIPAELKLSEQEMASMAQMAMGQMQGQAPAAEAPPSGEAEAMQAMEGMVA